MKCVSTVRERIVPILRRQPGLLSLALIPNADQNEITIISVWASSNCARTIEKDPGYRQEIDHLDVMFVGTALYKRGC